MTQARWLKLMNAMGLPSSEACFYALRSAYSERHRHYHTVQHIDAMLHHFDSTSDLADLPNEVEIAIWFHDAIYKPFSSTNEKDSAEWAKDFLMANQYAGQCVDGVYKLIMATQHAGAVEHRDEKLIVDIDLTILGTPEHIYDEFECNVRKEYKWVPSYIYQKKRKQILQSFLAQESIYHLEFFKSKYEESARANINRAMTLL